MGDITRTMQTPQTIYVDHKWPMTEPTQFSTIIPWAPEEVPGRRVVDPPRSNGDGSYTYSIRYVRDDEPSVPVDTTPANRHERRQASSRKHQRAALHGAGDQKRIAVERRGAL